jgi:hypothetical protein
MSFILLKDNNNRFALFDKQTENLVGLLLYPSPNESRAGWVRDVGQIYDRKEIYNINDFPELSGLEIFAIEYLRPGDPF